MRNIFEVVDNYFKKRGGTVSLYLGIIQFIFYFFYSILTFSLMKNYFEAIIPIFISVFGIRAARFGLKIESKEERINATFGFVANWLLLIITAIVSFMGIFFNTWR